MHNGEQTIGIGWEVASHDLRLLVYHVIDEPWILMCETVVILPPYMAREQNVQTAEVVSPRNILAHFEPLGMLIEHGRNNVDERLVRVQQTMTTSQQIPLEPTFALMLAQNLHHTTVLCSMIRCIVFRDLTHKLTIGNIEYGMQTVAGSLIWSKNSEIAQRFVEYNHLLEKLTANKSIARLHSAARWHCNAEFFEIGQSQCLVFGICVRVAPHTQFWWRNQSLELWE
mmetsp:Transcript_9301/g.14001  ORF Transcript_9301/g.14001 Transcript_9301/m.14001 type:complete len:227 (+) Transcript_9301:668-1348(+)